MRPKTAGRAFQETSAGLVPGGVDRPNPFAFGMVGEP